MPPRKRLAAKSVHAARVACVVALLLLIPPPNTMVQPVDSRSTPPSRSLVKMAIPKMTDLTEAPDANGMWQVLDQDGASIAMVARTLPHAERVLGYRGPTESMIVVDDQGEIQSVSLLQSADTEEHVRAVRESEPFFEQFKSWSWAEPSKNLSIDAVSGATLTSLALAGGVLARMGDERASLVFTEEVQPDEIRKWFPEVATTLQEGHLIKVLNHEDATIGMVFRTGPLSDGVVGYQGPTELLVRLEAENSAEVDGSDTDPNVVSGVMIRSSFDNEPYVRYCRTEYSFWARFKSQTLEELSAMDLDAAGVEGVSGATMTSMAIGETLIESAAAVVREQKSNQQADSNSGIASSLKVRWSSADLACLAILFGIPIFRRMGWYRKKYVRIAWLLLVFVVIGIWSGNLISMALIAGWGGQGIAWRLAPGLAAIAAVTLVSPAIGKSNPYCNHLCPHGAVQQLLRPKKQSWRLRKLPSSMVKVLSWLPGCLLINAYATLLFRPSIDLSSWEPFHAYLFRIAPWSAIALAFLTLVFSSVVPMGFCRLGCPTGRLLDYLRRNAMSDRIQFSDMMAFGMLVVACCFRYLQ